MPILCITRQKHGITNFLFQESSGACLSYNFAPSLLSSKVELEQFGFGYSKKKNNTHNTHITTREPDTQLREFCEASKRASEA